MKTKQTINKQIKLLTAILILSVLPQVVFATGKSETQQTKTGVSMEKISFTSKGNTLSGNLYLPPNYNNKQTYPAIVVSGSWTTVKEQMAGGYAEKFAQEGFLTLAFDPTGYGESQGNPRYYENPEQKISDISSAVTFLEDRPDVDQDKIGAFGVCAGAAYTLSAAARDKRISSVVTAASWIHDAEAVKLFYGGEEGVQSKIRAAEEARTLFEKTGEVTYIPTISETDESAAMYGPYDYYLNPQRGAIPSWSADKFAVMSWKPWLTYDPTGSASQLNTPTMMIHSDGAVLPQYTKTYFDTIATPKKELIWVSTDMDTPFHQFKFYDQEDEMNLAVANGSLWFRETL